MTEHQEKDAAFLEYVVKALVDHPEEVHIERKVDEMGVLVTLDVHPDDMGNIIGRNGSTAKAIRTLLRVIGFQNNARVNLKINEPDREKSSAAAETTSSEPQTESTHDTAPTQQYADNDDVSRDVDQAIEDLKG